MKNKIFTTLLAAAAVFTFAMSGTHLLYGEEAPFDARVTTAATGNSELDRLIAEIRETMAQISESLSELLANGVAESEQGALSELISSFNQATKDLSTLLKRVENGQNGGGNGGNGGSGGTGSGGGSGSGGGLGGILGGLLGGGQGQGGGQGGLGGILGGLLGGQGGQGGQGGLGGALGGLLGGQGGQGGAGGLTGGCASCGQGAGGLTPGGSLPGTIAAQLGSQNRYGGFINDDSPQPQCYRQKDENGQCKDPVQGLGYVEITEPVAPTLQQPSCPGGSCPLQQPPQQPQQSSVQRKIVVDLHSPGPNQIQDVNALTPKDFVNGATKQGGDSRCKYVKPRTGSGCKQVQAEATTVTIGHIPR